MKAKKFLSTLRLLLSWAPRVEAVAACDALQRAVVSSRGTRLRSAGVGADDPVAAKMLKVADGVEDLAGGELVTIPGARENYHKALARELLDNQAVWAALEDIAVALRATCDDRLSLAEADEIAKCAERCKQMESSNDYE